jgi:NADH:ubiquinone oxidoreductase subunit F (NADH-binding)/Pyruvate/2-oxoacid:ferredoxin oxidoreductase delta subunit
MIEPLRQVSDYCRHTRLTPCPDRIACLTGGPLCRRDPEAADAARKRAAGFRRETPEQPVILVGTGTCGLAAGAGKTLAALQVELARNQTAAELVEVGCIGLCSSEPIVDLLLPGRGRLSFGPVGPAEAGKIAAAADGGEIPRDLLLGRHQAGDTGIGDDLPGLGEHPFFRSQTRIVLENCGLIDPSRIEEYIARGGYRALSRALKSLTPAELCDLVERSGLRGRGGGGFLTGKKWKIALETTADRKFLICNADEGDPGAFMDRAVIEGDPHRLIEGMAIAAYAIRASKAYVYIRAEYPLAIRRLKEALRLAREEGLLGYNILDSGFNLEIAVKMGAGAFVCGEETALIGSIEGKRGMPRPRPPYPAVSGLFDCPTVVNNVETLANLPAIVDGGADKFRAVGTPDSAGTKVFALSGKIARTGLVEVAMGTKLEEIVFAIGGGVAGGKKFKAVQIGGPSGGCVPVQHLDTEVDYESLKRIGAMMGSGGLVVMDEDTCMVDVARFFMEFIQRESCGRCIPCREGTRQLLRTLQSLTSRRGTAGLDPLQRFQSVINLKKLAETIKETSLCGLGQSAPNPILSTLRFFRDEYEAHVYERRCPSGGCVELRTFRIDPEKCVGCTACVSKCPAGAIKGTAKKMHYILLEKCVGCGACFEACRFGAIVRE